MSLALTSCVFTSEYRSDSDTSSFDTDGRPVLGSIGMKSYTDFARVLSVSDSTKCAVDVLSSENRPSFISESPVHLKQ